ncbi:MAG: 3-hydroxyacyl-CoA dehydrogenase family protein [Chlamydiales bacterium]|nr:3-hydroxyacyl-CoA dehydrogenase family protein [Chlamydiales bacterium]
MNQENKVAVLGAGIMGSGVALDLAIHNIPVVLYDLTDQILEKSKERMLADYRKLQFFKKDVKLPSKDELFTHIVFTKDLKSIDGVHFIIENIREKWESKKALYESIQPYCSEKTILAANTSCVPITKIAQICRHPQNVLGMHFMNPVPLKNFVEVIRGFHTTQETVDLGMALLKKLDKMAVVVNDSPGFVSNRISHLYMNEAAFLVHEGVATASEIDKIFKVGYGHKMGPLETCDLIGVDTVVDSLAVLYESFQDPKFRCCPLLNKMVAAGHLGQKSGQGFFKY